MFAHKVCHEGQIIFDNALAGLRDFGVDIRNPLQMLLLLKKLGAAGFEQLFASHLDPEKWINTDMLTLSRALVDSHRSRFLEADFVARVEGRCLIVASSDVHSHASGALAQLLGEAGARVIYLGAEQNPSDLVEAVKKHSADALLLSTHNGMALEYGRQLKQLLDQASLSLPVIMGGVLNQKVDGQALPVTVVEELKALGLRPAVSLPGLTRLLS